MEFKQALQARRSIYALSNELIVADDVLEATIAYAVRYTPSAFDSQSPRVVLLLDGKHAELWKIVLDALRKIVPADAFPRSEAKIKSFAAGRGTVLFFEDAAVTDGLVKAYPLYAQNFPIWAREHGGMLQGNVWVGLAEIGYGASLQHYNELIEADVKQALGVPASWRLIAQMPFGKTLQAPKPKTFQPIDNRFRVLR